MKLTIIHFLAVAALVGAAQAQQGLPQTQTNFSPLKQVKLLDTKKKGARSVSFCSATRDLFVAFEEEGSRKIHCWNIGTAREEGSYAIPRGYRCDSTLPSPDGKYLLTTAYDMSHDALQSIFKVILFDAQTRKAVKELNFATENITFIQFSRDGTCFRLSPGLLSRFPNWPASVYDLKGNKLTNIDMTVFSPAESTTLGQGEFKDPSLYYTKGGVRQKLIDEAFDYLSTDANSFFASSTFSGEVAVWRASDLKQVFRNKIGEHPIWIRYDDKQNQLLVVNGSDKESSSVWAVQLGRP